MRYDDAGSEAALLLAIVPMKSSAEEHGYEARRRPIVGQMGMDLGQLLT